MTTPMRLFCTAFCTAWLGKLKSNCPPSPWSRIFSPEVPVAFAAAVAPVTPEPAVNGVARTLILYRIGQSPD